MDILSPTEGIYFTSAQWGEGGRQASALRKRVERGTTLQLRPGVFREATSPVLDHEEIVTAYLACSLRAEQVGVIGAAAAALWGYPDLYRDIIDIAVPGASGENAPRSMSADILLVSRRGWFDRPRRFVDRAGVAVLRPEWLAVDLLERRVGDRDHVRQFLDHAERNGYLTAGALVTPLAELISPQPPVEGTLTTNERAIIVQLAAWSPDSSDGPIRRDGSGTSQTRPPALGSDDERRLVDSTRGYWVLDVDKAAQHRWLVAARRGRTLAVLRITSAPLRHGARYWFEAEVETEPTIVEAFVGVDGRTFRPTRNPIRYWPSP